MKKKHQDDTHPPPPPLKKSRRKTSGAKKRGKSFVTDFGGALEQFPGEGYDAEEHVQAAIVDEDGGAPVGTLLQTRQPVLDVVDVPRPL